MEIFCTFLDLTRNVDRFLERFWSLRTDWKKTNEKRQKATSKISFFVKIEIEFYIMLLQRPVRLKL